MALNKFEITVYYIIEMIAFVGGMIFVTNNYLKSKSITSILFGAMLGLVFIKYVASEVNVAKAKGDKE